MKYFWIILMICPIWIFGQEKYVAKEVQSLIAQDANFENIPLFSKVDHPSLVKSYENVASDINLLQLNHSGLKEITKNKPNHISLEIPYQHESIRIQLYQKDIFSDGYEIVNDAENPMDYIQGVYYRGIVEGDSQSIVALSFFKNDVIGIISTLDKGNIVVAKTNDSRYFVTYAEHNLFGEFPFQCGVEAIEGDSEGSNAEIIPYDSNELTTCVKLYYEISYQLYEAHDFDSETALNWLSGVQNNVSTLYENDGVCVEVKKVKINEQPDGYTGDSAENLNNFWQNTTDQFSGDLAHLLNYPADWGGRAYLDALCTPYAAAYSELYLTYNNVPTYSWTVKVMTHEMGHSFGSPHTHDCAWNGNNTQIDNCGPFFDPAYNLDGCDETGPIPYEEGGTIMSYCHLLSTVGVNFANGFGEQPAQLIRNTINSKYCIGKNKYRAKLYNEPEDGGEVYGAGYFYEGTNFTVSAVAEEGYEFLGWTKNGTFFSASKTLVFESTEDIQLVANYGPYSGTDNCPTKEAQEGDYYGFDVHIREKAVDFLIQPDVMVKVEELIVPFWYEGNPPSEIWVNFYKDNNNKPGTPIWSSPKNFSVNFTTPYTYQEAYFDISPYDLILDGAEATRYWVGFKVITDLYIDEVWWYVVEEEENNTPIYRNLGIQEAPNWGPISGHDGVISINFSCENESKLLIANSNPQGAGTLTGSGRYENGEMAQLNAIPNGEAIFENWTLDGEIVSTSPDFEVEVLEDQVYVANFQGYMGVEDLEWNHIVLYPNPFDNHLSIQSADLLTQITVYDLRGRELISVKPSTNETRLDTSALSPGVYFVKLIKNGQTQVKKVIKR